MFVRISNTPRDYAWGSPTAIPELLGLDETGAPQAELWLGAHAGSPSVIVEPDTVGGARDLREWIEREPGVALAAASTHHVDAAPTPPTLPFLLKVLAASAPLSLQGHPTPEQARAGFEAENAAGIPLDAAHRNYRDEFAKPEIIVAVSERFEALCGFRPLDATRALLTVLVDAAQHRGLTGERIAVLRDSLGTGDVAGDARVSTGSTHDQSLADAAGDARVSTGSTRDQSLADAAVIKRAVEQLLAGDSAALVDEVVAAAESAENLMGKADEPADARSDEPRAAIETVLRLADAYPGDPGIVLSLLLNRVTLTPGEALWLPAGNIHAYLEGVGIELMASSDNVLRGGLTPKHVDVAELLTVLEFEPQEPPVLPRVVLPGGVTAYRPPVPDFELVHVAVSSLRRTGASSARPAVPLTGPAIVLVTSGEVRVTGEASALALARGEAAFVTPDETSLIFSGDGDAYIATGGRG